MPDRKDRVRLVADEIAQYLETHPQAADSLEGIATWWIARQRIRDELEIVREALAQLTSAGIVTSSGEDAPVYRLLRDGMDGQDPTGEQT